MYVCLYACLYVCVGSMPMMAEAEHYKEGPLRKKDDVSLSVIRHLDPTNP